MSQTKTCRECGAEIDRKELPDPDFSGDVDDEYWICDECGHGYKEGTI